MRALFLLALLALATPVRAQEVAPACLTAFASRYTHETERNLDRTFRPAEHHDAILLFDEADALFGRRTDTSDAHDRYANIEISYLLERIERFEHIEHLASNNRRLIAAGFNRRSRNAGVVIIETEAGARMIEFTRATRARALAYAEASLEACPSDAAATDPRP